MPPTRFSSMKSSPVVELMSTTLLVPTNTRTNMRSPFPEEYVQR